MPKLDDWEKIVYKNKKDPLRARSIMILPIILKMDIKLLKRSEHIVEGKEFKKAMKKLKKFDDYLKSKYLVKKYHADSHKKILEKSKKLFKLYKDIVKDLPKGIDLNLTKYMKHFERNLSQFLNEISRLNRRYKHIYADAVNYCKRNGLSIEKDAPHLMYIFRDPSTKRSVSFAAFYNRKSEDISLLGIGMLTSQKYIDILFAHEIFYHIEKSIENNFSEFYSKLYGGSEKDIKSAAGAFKKGSKDYVNNLKRREETTPEKSELINHHQDQIEIAEKSIKRIQDTSSRLTNDIAKDIGKQSFKDIMNSTMSKLAKESRAFTHYRDQIYQTAHSIDESLYNSSRNMYHFDNNIGNLWKDDYKAIYQKIFKLSMNRVLKDFGKEHFLNIADYLAYKFVHDVLGTPRGKSINVLKGAADSRRHQKKRINLIKNQKVLNEVDFTMKLASMSLRSGLVEA